MNAAMRLDGRVGRPAAAPAGCGEMTTSVGRLTWDRWRCWRSRVVHH